MQFASWITLTAIRLADYLGGKVWLFDITNNLQGTFKIALILDRLNVAQPLDKNTR